LYLWQLVLVEAAGYLPQQQPRKGLTKFARHVRSPWHDYGAGSAGFATPFEAITHPMCWSVWSQFGRPPQFGGFPSVGRLCAKSQARESRDNPRLKAFCRVAPSVRFNALAILAARVFLRARVFKLSDF
jgi:hypothetical protein